MTISSRLRAIRGLAIFAAVLSFLQAALGAQAGHNPGRDCLACHSSFSAAGTVFKTASASETAPDVPVVFTGMDGAETVLFTNSNGNLATSILPAGRYLVRVNAITSRTWHILPAQASCNACHAPRGNGSEIRTRLLHAYHTRLPADNDCRHCHHFPASQSYDLLKTAGVLQAESADPSLPGSRVEILGRVFDFDPSQYTINTRRPDIFALGYFSMFDVILAVAQRNNISISSRFDPFCMTHFISKIDGRTGNFWYRFSYDAGNGNAQELNNKRAIRWDEALWRPGVWIRVTEGENLVELQAAYMREILREVFQGHVIPNVRISINPSDFQGNPPGSGRLTVSREFQNVKVTPHEWRSEGASDPTPKPFRPGVVTSLDILLSLQDQGLLDLVTGAFYTFFAGHYIHSYYVVAMGFPGVGTAHASGRHGFVYTTENGTPGLLPNGADSKMHITSDIHVVHAQDFSYWRWAELGNPYYENVAPGSEELLQASIAEDFEAIGRGFNLHSPIVLERGEPMAFAKIKAAMVPEGGSSLIGSRARDAGIKVLLVSFNVFEPGIYRVEIRDSSGAVLERLHDGRVENIGVVRKTWAPRGLPPGRYALVLTDGKRIQVRELN